MTSRVGTKSCFTSQQHLQSISLGATANKAKSGVAEQQCLDFP